MATAEQKTALVKAAHHHRAADMLLKGTYVDTDAGLSFRGCSVGCMLRDVHPTMTLDDLYEVENKHREVADHFGYPEWLALLQDTIFEGLPSPEHQDWHVQLADALALLPDDHNWQAALHRVHAGILRITYRTAGSAQEVVKTVLDLHERAGRGEGVSADLWSAAWSAAESAARSAAWSAAESAARSAAWSAAWSAAESAAWSAAYQEMRDAILAALPEPIAS